jgi:hypothetical protein
VLLSCTGGSYVEGKAPLGVTWWVMMVRPGAATKRRSRLSQPGFFLTCTVAGIRIAITSESQDVSQTFSGDRVSDV